MAVVVIRMDSGGPTADVYSDSDQIDFDSSGPETVLIVTNPDGTTRALYRTWERATVSTAPPEGD